MSWKPSARHPAVATRAATLRSSSSGPNPRTRQGFSASQLLHYMLEPDPELPLAIRLLGNKDKDAPG
jgi:hypothetical protein